MRTLVKFGAAAAFALGVFGAASTASAAIVCNAAGECWHVKRALAWVKQHIAEYGGDPDFIAITGGSAGGHLSSLAALTPNYPQFQPGFEDADTRVQAAYLRVETPPPSPQLPAGPGNGHAAPPEPGPRPGSFVSARDRRQRITAARAAGTANQITKT